MRITRLEARIVEIPVSSPYVFWHGVLQACSHVLVWIYSNGGLVGVGGVILRSRRRRVRGDARKHEGLDRPLPPPPRPPRWASTLRPNSSAGTLCHVMVGGNARSPMLRDGLDRAHWLVGLAGLSDQGAGTRPVRARLPTLAPLAQTGSRRRVAPLVRGEA